MHSSLQTETNNPKTLATNHYGITVGLQQLNPTAASLFSKLQQSMTTAEYNKETIK